MLLKDILSKQKDLFLVDNHGNTSFHFACQSGNLSAVEFLLEENKDHSLLSFQSYSGKTPPMLACENGHSEVIQHIFSKLDNDEIQAIVSHRDFDGNQLLHIAAKNGNLSLLEVLISPFKNERANHIIDLNPKNNWNETPLECAAKKGNYSFLISLQDKGAVLPLTPDFDNQCCIQGYSS